MDTKTNLQSSTFYIDSQLAHITIKSCDKQPGTHKLIFFAMLIFRIFLKSHFVIQ